MTPGDTILVCDHCRESFSIKTARLKYGKGRYCSLLCRRAYETDPVHVAERFWSKVDRSGGPDACWPHESARPNHPPMFYLNGKRRQTSAVAYELTRGPMPEGMHACHHCDNPPCCNPAHIFPGTRIDNMRDCSRKGRHGSITHPELVPRGERHGRHTKPERTARGGRVQGPERKLSVDVVREIRAAYEAGGVSQYQLADRYGVAQSAISRAIRGERWGWVDG